MTSNEPGANERVGCLVREEPDAFDALRDAAAERHGVDPGSIEKDYWATEVLRSATTPLDGVDCFVFKGGTSLSKAYGIIERFSEDVDLLVISEHSGKALKRLLRTVAARTTDALGLGHDREFEGNGFLNARYGYPARREVAFLTSGVLLEMGSRGGPLPNERLPVRSLMSHAAVDVNRAAAVEYVDLAPFDAIVLAPERTLAEKLAFLHHRATIGDIQALTIGARHLYDVVMLLSSDRVTGALGHGEMRELMADVDKRSQSAGWPYTPRPDGGFADSPAFVGDRAVLEPLRDGYEQVASLVWGTFPSLDEAIDIVRSCRHLL
ncbi:MAG: nucleotidyl transferase AbiEii/AbiGii toxin family protein [Acidimicrobiales bacterium]